jgi:hypothetical protein
MVNSMALKLLATALIGWGLTGSIATAAPNPDGVELLIVGAQPTQQLKLKPIVGSKQQRSLIWDWQSEVNVGGQVTALPFPSIQASIVTQVQKIDLNGDIHYELRYRNIGVKEDGMKDDVTSKSSSKLTAVFKQSLESLAGMTATSVISPQGKTKSTKITWPNQPGRKLDKTQQSLLDKFSESVGSLSAPLPEFPIGIGARWQQKSPVTVNGITFEQQMVYELTDRRDDVATIQVSIEQSIPASSKQPTTGTQFRSLKSKGQGQLVWDLNQPIPTTSSLQLKSEAQIQPLDKIGKDDKSPPSEPIAVTSQINFKITSP